MFGVLLLKYPAEISNCAERRISPTLYYYCFILGYKFAWNESFFFIFYILQSWWLVVFSMALFLMFCKFSKQFRLDSNSFNAFQLSKRMNGDAKKSNFSLYANICFELTSRSTAIVARIPKDSTWMIPEKVLTNFIHLQLSCNSFDNKSLLLDS